MITQNDTSPIDFFMADNTDSTGETPKTGLTPTVTLSKNGGAFGAAAGTVAEISGGWYRLTPTSGDTGTLGDLAIMATAAGAFTWRDRDRVAVASLAASAYTAPDNASIGTIATTVTAIASAITGLPAAVWANVSRTLTAIADSTGVTTLLSRVTGTVPTANQNADALLDRTDAVETGMTPRGALRLLTAAEAGDTAGMDTGTITIHNAVANSKVRINATGDASGNRVVTSTDLT